MMDYNLAALKLLCIHLKASLQSETTPGGFTLGGILFQRAWVQGVLVSVSLPSDSSEGGGRFLLDDGTGIIQLGVPPSFLDRHWEPGTYVMVVGPVAFLPPYVLPVIKVHKIVDLSASPNREPMWYLEVMEAFKLFYEPMFSN